MNSCKLFILWLWKNLNMHKAGQIIPRCSLCPKLMWLIVQCSHSLSGGRLLLDSKTSPTFCHSGHPIELYLLDLLSVTLLPVDSHPVVVRDDVLFFFVFPTPSLVETQKLVMSDWVPKFLKWRTDRWSLKKTTSAERWKGGWYATLLREVGKDPELHPVREIRRKRGVLRN